MAEPGDGTSDDHRGLTEADYDWSSRHIIAARLVEALVPPGGRVLDIGGAAGVAVDLLPHHDVTVADVIGGGVDVIASGTDLPFRDRSFAAAISLDVLEHVDSQQKPAMVSEAVRVADAVVLAGPYDDAGVREAEAEQREGFEVMYGYEHPWLSEHFELGLPALNGVVEQLSAAGLQTGVFGSNPLRLWSELRFGTHVAQLFDIDRETWPLRRYLVETFLDGGDAAPPSYRHFVVGARNADVAGAIDLVRPGADAAAADATLEKARHDTLRIIGAAGANIPELQVHAHNLEAGMAELHQELDHRLEVIDDLTEEAERRLNIINEVTEKADALETRLHAIEEAVQRDRVTRSIVDRRLKRPARPSE